MTNSLWGEKRYKKVRKCAKCAQDTTVLYPCRIMLDKLESYPLCEKCWQDFMEDCKKKRQIIIGDRILSW
jgi:hypothetical protein